MFILVGRPCSFVRSINVLRLLFVFFTLAMRFVWSFSPFNLLRFSFTPIASSRYQWLWYNSMRYALDNNSPNVSFVLWLWLWRYTFSTFLVRCVRRSNGRLDTILVQDRENIMYTSRRESRNIFRQHRRLLMAKPWCRMQSKIAHNNIVSEERRA